MTPTLRSLLLAVIATGAACAAVLAQTETAKAEGARAIDRCEASVADTLRNLRGKQAQDVQFVKTKRVLAATDDDETSVKGEGQYRGAAGGSTSFSYSCAFNSKTGQTSGVMLREATSETARGEPAWQPDLSRMSPEVCESAAAAMLKDKHPRVARISLDSESRRLLPGADDHIVLVGQGAVQRAPGMSAVPFTYRCEFDNRTGKLVAVQTSV
jgi:hypothetical protein